MITKGVALGVIAMAIVVVSSNFLVQYPINDWLTYGAFTYPIAFLVTDLTNRTLGSVRATRVVYVGFTIAVMLSIYFATWRIALASGCAFMASQLIDIRIFDRLRERTWWRPPLISSLVASVVDTVLFFSIAFAGTAVPWVTLAAGDFVVKLAVAAAMLIPFRLLLDVTRPATVKS